ncbi:MAG: riboflavin biosynthesis protein RibF [Pseudomonadota bacterium]
MLHLLRHIKTIPERKMIWMIGNFDGVHKGHQALIETAKLNAGSSRKVGLLTFEPHPRKVFKPELDCFRAQQFVLKLRALEDYGVDYCYCYAFTKTLAAMSADDFCAQILAEHLDPHAIVVGHDFCFGKGREGTPEYLVNAGQKYGFDVYVVSEQAHMGKRYSSAALRNFIAEGNIAAIEEFLGRAYKFHGNVRKGRQVARELGYPTANIAPPDVMYPKYGVYLGHVTNLSDRPLPAIANIGIKPTLGGDEKPIIEIHIRDFSADLYGKKLTFAFKKFLRPEQKFDSIAALKDQIEKDINVLYQAP